MPITSYLAEHSSTEKRDQNAPRVATQTHFDGDGYNE